jgi:hypothetical protein
MVYRYKAGNITEITMSSLICFYDSQQSVSYSKRHSQTLTASLSNPGHYKEVISVHKLKVDCEQSEMAKVEQNTMPDYLLNQVLFTHKKMRSA